MNPIKKLLGETAVYGVSSVLARLLNFLMVFVHTTYLDKVHDYGVVTQLYAYAAFFLILLPHGMETTYFRFAKEKIQEQEVYSTAYFSVFMLSSLFLVSGLFFNQEIANFLHISHHPEYISWFSMILTFDAIATIPFAKMREENAAKKFAIIKTINILVNISVTLFFLVFCYKTTQNESFVFHGFVTTIYNPQMNEGYIFIANLAASIITLLLVIPYIKKLSLKFDAALWLKMLKYGFPLIILGLAGIINETLDRALLDYFLTGSIEERKAQIGIYGACYKLTMIITISVQAFRYAAEPFFFKQSQGEKSKQVFADVMKYFTLFLVTVFLGTLLYIDLFKYLIDKKYHVGLKVVPILMLANVFLGMLYNLSIWYKLTDKTGIGAWVSIGGALVTIVLNILWIPIYGYEGSAWATLICYAAMTLVSYILGRFYYPVPYNIPRIISYLVIAISFYVGSLYVNTMIFLPNLLINTVLFILFLVIVFVLEKPKKVVN